MKARNPSMPAIVNITEAEANSTSHTMALVAPSPQKANIYISHAVAVLDYNGSQLTWMTTTLGYSRGHHGWMFSCTTLCSTAAAMLINAALNRCREDDCSAGKTLDPWTWLP